MMEIENQSWSEEGRQDTEELNERGCRDGWGRLAVGEPNHQRPLRLTHSTLDLDQFTKIGLLHC